jgi:hypothetical protein
MALKQKPAWDVSSSGIMNGVIRVHLKPAKTTLRRGPETDRVAARGRDRLPVFMDHRPVFTHFALAPARAYSCKLRANCRYERSSIAGRNHHFPGEAVLHGYLLLRVKAMLVMPLRFYTRTSSAAALPAATPDAQAHWKL